MELKYTRKGDYLYPNLSLENDPTVTVGKYGLMRKSYLKENKKAWYQSLLITGRLTAHLLEIEQTAQERIDRMVEQMLTSNPAPEKETHPLGWARHMNSLTAAAEETVLRELVYN